VPPGSVPAPGSPDLEQVQGFVYVGSGTLVLLGVAVVVLGLAGRPGQAEAMGTLGLIAYLVYLLIALALVRRTTRRAARRAAPWQQPPQAPQP
jgi:peptidoglycan/LPS O-acetylase OafA/YrhL